MLENTCQVGCHRRDSADWNAQLAVIHCTRPGRRMSHVKKRLFGVQDDRNARTGGHPECTNEVVVLRLERGNEFAAKLLGSLFAFVAQGEVTALTLREVSF